MKEREYRKSGRREVKRLDGVVEQGEESLCC